MLSKRLFKTTSFQLTLLFGLIFAFSFVALLLITFWTTTTALRGQMQTEVQSQLASLTTEADSDGISTIIHDIEERITPSDRQTEYYFLSDSTGRKLAGNLDGISTEEGWREDGLSGDTFKKTETLSDDDHEIWGQGTHLADGSFLLVGQDAFRIISAQESVISTFIWSSGIALFLAIVAGLALSRGFLRRIDDINNTSLAIIDGRLKERIPIRGSQDEIDQLSANLNRLFDSNQALLESLKQVSANIAHDLRAPLTRLRQGLEDAKTTAKNSENYAEAIDAAVIEADQLLATFTALLRIAQIESGSRKSGFKSIDLTSIFVRVASAYRAVAEDQEKELVTTLDENVMFLGDGELLLQMIANLTENAIRHTPAGTRIELRLKMSDEGLMAGVHDSGPGIPREHHVKVFEHFFRLDNSRATPGNGLGLSLVSAISTLHGIKITLHDNSPGLRVTLQFPTA